MHLPLPGFLRPWSILTFAKMYQINLEEAEKPYDQYNSIGDFFVRRLKPGARPIDQSVLVHPADSQITQLESIQDGKLIQAKGKTYSLSDFIGRPQAQEEWKKGFFVTYYLCPTDYHRVHSPVDGEIIEVTHIPGQLWPVNQWSVENIDQLFSINERVVLRIRTSQGIVALVFVGATNVGKISLSFDQTIVSNNLKDHQPVHKVYSQPISIQKGQELGMFHMGSTVVMVYPEVYKVDLTGLQSRFQNQKVKMGQGLVL